MALTNSIDDRQFLFLQGEVLPPRELLEMDQRNGVEGTEFTLLAKKGVPFQLFSQVDMPSYDAAVTEANDYLKLIDKGLVDLYANGIDYLGFGYKIKVLSVTPVRIKAIRSAVGGINPPSLAWLEAAWDLIAVPMTY